MLFQSNNKLKIKLGKRKYTIKKLDTIEKVRVRDTIKCLELILIRFNGHIDIYYSNPEWYGYGLPVKDYMINPKDLRDWYLEPTSWLKYLKYAISGCYTSSNPYSLETYYRIEGDEQLFFEEYTKTSLYYSKRTSRVYKGKDVIERVIQLENYF